MRRLPTHLHLDRRPQQQRNGNHAHDHLPLHPRTEPRHPLRQHSHAPTVLRQIQEANGRVSTDRVLGREKHGIQGPKQDWGQQVGHSCEGPQSFTVGDGGLQTCRGYPARLYCQRVP